MFWVGEGGNHRGRVVGTLRFIVDHERMERALESAGDEEQDDQVVRVGEFHFQECLCEVVEISFAETLFTYFVVEQAMHRMRTHM